MTTPLTRRLVRQIGQSGPISVADYMAACLFDPRHGYYTTRDPFGRGGDFVTAPEISQMFGELIAVWFVAAWQQTGAPQRFALAEIGPGRATLMRDMLRTWQKTVPEFLSSAEMFMIEASPRLAAIQKDALRDRPENMRWIARLEDTPELPLFLVGNELFDAIPVRQYVKTGRAWRERVVTLVGDEELSFGIGAGALAPDALPADASDRLEGSIFEIAPAREALAALAAERIASFGGAALFIDYGHLEPGFGDTLQAVRNHLYEDALANPGMADLTSHVDFAALATAARRQGAESACMTQGDFLLRMGLLERAGQLGANADEKTRRQIEADVERLAGPDAMGKLFKTMAIFPPGCAIPPFRA